MTSLPQTDNAYQRFREWLILFKERGGDATALEASVTRLLERVQQELVREVEQAPVMAHEPSDLAGIRALRPKGPRRMLASLDPAVLRDKLRGAWLGRAAGCILGIPCEGMSKTTIRNAARALGMSYPLRDYWVQDPKLADPMSRHYGLTPRRHFTKPHLTYAGTDDDLTYTLLGLLILEQYGPDFTTADVGEAWLKYLPMACTAEHVALENLKAGVDAATCGAHDNPYVDWIGADIRSDPWAYAAPGWPEKAAEFAYRDACLSHRATGIHGEMYFSAALAAAFAVSCPIQALEIGLSEIPRRCRTAQVVKDTLKWCERDGDWHTTTERVLSVYAGMSMAHTLNNAALTVAGIVYGAGDFGKTIALTVMGGVDTDCTGATAGSLLGAVLGARQLPAKWVKPLGTRAESYLIGRRRWTHDDVVERFATMVGKVCG